MKIEKKDFGKTKDGKVCSLYTLTNKNGMSVSLTDFGATIVSVIVPDKDGNMKDVVLGYDDVTGFEEGGCFFGAVIGRSGNRIQNGRFVINGKEYQLDINDNDNNLHSGNNGFDSRVWDAAAGEEKNAGVFSL